MCLQSCAPANGDVAAPPFMRHSIKMPQVSAFDWIALADGTGLPGRPPAARDYSVFADQGRLH